ncbi:MAG: hypothetical protein HFF90_01045 [Oscillibacter sp.]|nr:hypothetical protein [Oscillibacter sp.]
MSYVIKAVLSNSQHPECGQVTVPFPIPVEQYDQTMEMLQAMELGSSISQDCKVDELDSRYSALGALKGRQVRADELDYLAKRLDSFCGVEASQFEAMAYKLKLSNIEDFINLTFFCQRVTVITDSSDLEQRGKDHILMQNGSGTMTPFAVADGPTLEEFLQDSSGEQSWRGPQIGGLT